METSAIINIASLVDICAAKGMRHIVFSPGSRNAPLAIAFNRHPLIELYSIVDERSAAFVAMGIAQQTNQLVGICCTSGTAALNYYPAIAEAYYQRIPLVAITADRPNEWIDQGAGQTIRQNKVFENHVQFSAELPIVNGQSVELWHSDRTVNQALNAALHPVKGPVHINVPLREPLYETAPKSHDPKIHSILPTSGTIDEAQFDQLNAIWKASAKKLILCGLMSPNEKLGSAINKLAEDPSVHVLTETTSNVYGPKINSAIDRFIEDLSQQQEEEFRPDLLLTIGGPIISKKIKFLLRKLKPKHHWRVDPKGEQQDTFESLTLTIPLKAEQFISKLNAYQVSKSNYASTLAKWKKSKESKHKAFLAKAAYSDLIVLEKVVARIPSDSDLQMGNSTIARYIQLYEQREDIIYNGNRGTSGIDGSTSTAVGAAIASNKRTTLITGELSFFYDVNALWNEHLPSNLKIIIINNYGGGIFRIIDGPSKVVEKDQFFEATHNRKAEEIVKAYNIPYYSANDILTLEKELENLYNDSKCAVLEIFTPREQNDKVLKSYFDSLAR